MQKILSHTIVLVLGASLLVGCGSSGKAVSNTPDGPGVQAQAGIGTGDGKLDDNLKVKIERTYFEAEKAKALGDFDEALKLYNQVIKLDPKNSAAYYELARIYYGSQLMGQAEETVDLAIKYEPENKWYKMLKAEILAMTGQNAEAAELYAWIVDQNPQFYDNYFILAELYEKSDQFGKAIGVYNDLEEQLGIDEYIIDQKKKLYLKQNDIEGAAAELQKLIKLYPEDPMYLGLLAEMYEANGFTDKAIKVYEDLVAMDPDNPYALIALADISGQGGDHEKYMSYLKQAFASDELDIDTKVKVLYPYIEFYEMKQDEMGDAHELAEELTKAHPDEAKAFAIQGDLLYLDGKDEEALAAYNKSLELQQDIFSVWQQVMLIYSDREEYVKLRDHCKEAMMNFPNQAVSYFFKGIAEYQLAEYEPATKTLTKGLKMVYNNQGMKAQMYATLGDAYNEIKMHRESDSCYEASIKIDPTNPYTLNNYSYHLSVRGVNLDRAEELSKKSNDLEPDNSSFLDTYAWILYKQGEYSKALEYQKRAMDLTEEDNATLLEHYGDILFQMDRVDEAVQYWQRALKAGGDEELLGKKIANKQLYE